MASDHLLFLALCVCMCGFGGTGSAETSLLQLRRRGGVSSPLALDSETTAALGLPSAEDAPAPIDDDEHDKQQPTTGQSSADDGIVVRTQTTRVCVCVCLCEAWVRTLVFNPVISRWSCTRGA